MGEFSIYHLIIVIVVILMLFGGRKLPELMRALGQSIGSFREGLNENPKNPPSESSKNPAAQSK